MLDKQTRYPGVELNHNSVNPWPCEAILIQESILRQLSWAKYADYISAKHTLKHPCNSNTFPLYYSKVSLVYEHKYKYFYMEKNLYSWC